MWQITKLEVVPSFDGLSDVVLKVHWKLTLSYQGLTDSIEGVYPLDPPKQETFTDYSNLTEQQVFDWMFNAPIVKDRFKFPIAKQEVEQLLLDRLKKKYEEQNQAQSVQLPWG